MVAGDGVCTGTLIVVPGICAVVVIVGVGVACGCWMAPGVTIAGATVAACCCIPGCVAATDVICLPPDG